MNLFKKALGFIAGSALALGLATGAMAGSEPSTATLANKGGELCYVSAGTGSFDFGTWTWNGTTLSYDAPSGTSTFATVTVNVTQKISSQNVDCKVSAAPNDLVNGPNAIPSTNMVADVNSTGLNNAVLSTPKGAGVPNVPVKVTLNDNTNIDSFPPGTYNGTVTISVIQASI